MKPVETRMETIKVAKKGDLFICHFVYGDYATHRVRVGDTDQVMEVKGKTEFVTNTLRLYLVTEKRNVVSYTYRDNGETVDPYVYIEKKNDLKSRATNADDEDSDGLIFENVEDEVEYLRFTRRSFDINYETIRTETPVYVEWLGELIDSGNVYIKPMATSGDTELSTLYTYRREEAMCGMIDAFFKVRDLKYTNSTHSGFRYMKFGENYLFSDENYRALVGQGNRSRLTLDEAKSMYEDDVNKITAHLSRVLAVHIRAPITVNYTLVANHLSEIARIADSVKAKQTSESDLRRLQKKIYDLNTWLSEQALGQV